MYRKCASLAGVADPALLARLAGLNAGAPVLPVQHGRIEPAELFADASGGACVKFPDLRAWATASDHSHDAHDPEIQSYAIVRTAPIPAVALTLLLEALAEHCGAELLRLKGIVSIAESPDRPAVIHGVQHVFHPPAWLERWPSADRGSRIVIITRGVPQRWIELLLDAIGVEVASVTT